MARANADVVIVGGGIAGLATAAALAGDGQRPLLLERERMLASHSSGRNAAIWLPAEDDLTTPPLARRSAEILDERLGGRGAWLGESGALLVSEEPARLATVERGALRFGAKPERLDGDEAARREPLLDGGRTRAALWVPEAGVIDIHAVTQGLARAAREAGARIETGLGVARLNVRAGRVEGVELADGSRVPAGAVLLAAGAWAAALGAASGVPLPLAPLRRHLVHLETPGRRGGGATVWALGPGEVYFRLESAGLLASPCDETPWPPEPPPPDAEGVDELARRLGRVAPGLLAGRVRRVWACLRTFAPDRELAIGPDPRVRGLFWMAGLGGRGMTVGTAAGELAARFLQGEEPPLAKEVAPARLL